MAEYYLISQLPSLDGISEATPVPITEERFLDLCGRSLGEAAQKTLAKLTLSPSRDLEEMASPLLDAWMQGERDLRLALAKVRAEKLSKPFDMANKSLPAELLKVAATAVELESPMEAEKFLSDYRLGFLEFLRPTDPFCEDFVYYYGLKLKLLLRSRQFDTRLGEAEYRNIYNSIMNGDRLEAI